MRRRNGFTLVETLIAVVILGLVVLIGIPKMSSAMVASDLRSARTTMVNLVATARAASVQSNRLTWITFEGSTVHVVARPRIDGVDGPTGADTVGSVHDLADVYKVGVATTVDSIRFDPRGFGVGSGATDTIVLSRGGHSSMITIDGLGRVLK